MYQQEGRRGEIDKHLQGLDIFFKMFVQPNSTFIDALIMFHLGKVSIVFYLTPNPAVSQKP